MKKETFVFYLSQYEAIKDLNDDQIGRIFRAIFEEQLKTTSKQPQNNVVLTGAEKIAFNFIYNQMVVDNEKYLKKCETLKNNAKKGGAPKGNQNAKKQKQPKQPNREKNNLNDNDNDHDNDHNNTLYNPPKGNGEDDELFNTFWKEYPRKVSKGNAEKWFKRNKPDKYLVALMVEKLKVLKQSEQWSKENGKFIPYPASWLNAKGWEDEVNANDSKPKYNTTKIYHDEFMGNYKLDENGRRIFV